MQTLKCDFEMFVLHERSSRQHGGGGPDFNIAVVFIASKHKARSDTANVASGTKASEMLLAFFGA